MNFRWSLKLLSRSPSPLHGRWKIWAPKPGCDHLVAFAPLVAAEIRLKSFRNLNEKAIPDWKKDEFWKQKRFDQQFLWVEWVCETLASLGRHNWEFRATMLFLVVCCLEIRREEMRFSPLTRECLLSIHFESFESVQDLFSTKLAFPISRITRSLCWVSFSETSFAQWLDLRRGFGECHRGPSQRPLLSVPITLVCKLSNI